MMDFALSMHNDTLISHDFSGHSNTLVLHGILFSD